MKTLKSKVRGSLAIAQVAFFPKEKRLRVQMTDDSVYNYWGVSQNVYDELMAAPSKGQYFNANIRDSYQYSKG